MFKIQAFRSGHEQYYFQTASYGRVKGIEPAGLWTEASDRNLGIEGEVRPDEFSKFLMGIHPYSESVLDENVSKRKIATFDFILSAPKSVSLIGLIGSNEVETKVFEAHRNAVRETINWLECDLVKARRGSSKENIRVNISGLYGAQFLHRTSRMNDPHLHSHVVIANMVRGPDGYFSGADMRNVFSLSTNIGSRYQSLLRNELTKTLNLNWDRYRNGVADVCGVSQEAIELFSKRSQYLKSFAIRDGFDASTVAKPEKDLTVSVDSLKSIWREQATHIGLSIDKVLRDSYKNVGFEKGVPDYIKSEIGEMPKGSESFNNWAKLRNSIENYREKWNINDKFRALGKSKIELSQLKNVQTLRLSNVDALEKQIYAFNRGYSRSLDKKRSLEISL